MAFESERRRWELEMRYLKSQQVLLDSQIIVYLCFMCMRNRQSAVWT
jgi:hypothetical protein